jgi:hypothetical protein
MFSDLCGDGIDFLATSELVPREAKVVVFPHLTRQIDPTCSFCSLGYIDCQKYAQDEGHQEHTSGSTK